MTNFKTRALSYLIEERPNLESKFPEIKGKNDDELLRHFYLIIELRSGAGENLEKIDHEYTTITLHERFKNMGFPEH